MVVAVHTNYQDLAFAYTAFNSLVLKVCGVHVCRNFYRLGIKTHILLEGMFGVWKYFTSLFTSTHIYPQHNFN